MIERMAAVLNRWRGDVTPTELARRAGLSQPWVRAVMMGEGNPSRDTIVALCGALGKTEADLIRAMAEELDT